MNSKLATTIQFNPSCNERLKNLCGPCNEHLQTLENHFDVKILQKSNQFQITGDKTPRGEVKSVLEQLYRKAETPLTKEDIQGSVVKSVKLKQEIHTRKKILSGRTDRQNEFIKKLNSKTLNFAIGPAGTGKTYLSVAKSVEALEQFKVDRLVFVRPAVDAGEKLGFLPGDMVDKVLPYLRPIYDALYEMLGMDEVQKLISQDVIEIAPLAYMRGRTLNNAFILLDEAQNTTPAQMKMFLTRLGHGSRVVINGDVTQTDLPKGTPSGLAHAVKLISKIKDVGVTHFSAKDVVRHSLVAKIIDAYDSQG